MESQIQKFCLSWKDFNVIYNKQFEELRNSEDFFDITLACEDNQVNAHKLVLSAASDFFKDILRKFKHDHALVYLTDVRFCDLQAILDFIYTGETEVAEDNLESLLTTAGKLRIKGLTESQSNKDSEAKASEEENLAPIITEKEESKKKSIQGGKLGSKSTTITPTLVKETSSQSIKLEKSDINYIQITNASKLVRKPDPMDISNFLSPSEQQQLTGAENLESFPSKSLAIVNEAVQSQDYESNKNELERQCNELMVSSYDTSLGKTVWQCAQCHYSSKLRYTVKEHVETHISGFSHQCPLCEKSCNTRNALRVHTIRKHSNKVQVEKQDPQNQLLL